MATPAISQKADDLIIACEVGSRKQYEKKYRRPEWPGAASGVTVAIGYDLGYASPKKIRKDWSGRIPDAMVDEMIRCSSVTGAEAQRLLPRARRKINIPWEAAIAVYSEIDIPEWTQRVCDAIPGAAGLHPHCLGALTSLAYNRGASFKKAGSRYAEMRAIREHVMSGELDKVPADIRAMKRLWSPTKLRGLHIRRDKEAALFSLGLNSPTTAPLSKPRPSEAPEPLVPPPAAGAPEAGSGAAGGGLTTGAATIAHGLGLSTIDVVMIGVLGLAVTIAVIAYVRRHRTQPVLAREKG